MGQRAFWLPGGATPRRRGWMSARVAAILRWCEAEAIDWLYFLRPQPPRNARAGQGRRVRFRRFPLELTHTLDAKPAPAPGPPAPILIRPATAADLPAPRQLASSAYRDTRFSFDPHLDYLSARPGAVCPLDRTEPAGRIRRQRSCSRVEGQVARGAGGGVSSIAWEQGGARGEPRHQFMGFFNLVFTPSASLTSAPERLLTTSCTHALEMAALLLDIQPGDEVIVPSFTFVSTVNAFVLRGARPVFATSGPTRSTSTSGSSSGSSRRGPGPSCPCTTPGWAAKWTPSWRSPPGTGRRRRRQRPRPVRQISRPLAGHVRRLATQSFHETKNITCGEGGALLINDPTLHRARRDHPREGHQSQPVLPRPGRQIHLGGYRVQLPALRHAGSVSAGAARKCIAKSRPDGSASGAP